MNAAKYSNYDIAKAEANEIDIYIVKTLQSGKSFRVEAGAGSGKTYSLNKVIAWIQENRWTDLKARKQQVACITYTNAAVNVITNRLRPDSFIIPSTIHSFAWELIKQFQSTLLHLVIKLELIPEGHEVENIKSITYTLGSRYVDGHVLHLYHEDVIKLFANLLDNAKFRRILSEKYPIILIDEYQDSFKSITDQLLKWFIAKNTGPQFGLFGDSWQTIYSSNGVCGLLEHPNIEEIKKKSNFRSSPYIVNALNEIRPDLPQISAIDDFDGQIIIITSNDYTGPRQTGYYKDELPVDILKKRIDTIQKKLHTIHSWKPDDSKVLMITHKMLATQQGYSQLLYMLGDSFKDNDDIYLSFFSETIEPLYDALLSNNINKLFDILGGNKYFVSKKSQKKVWTSLKNNLENARLKTIRDVLEIVISSKLVPIMPQVTEYYQKYLQNPDELYVKSTLSELYNLPYSEILCAIDYLKPTALFSTDHSVKGEEYENILFVIGRGWNNYQFEKYLPLNLDKLKGKEHDAYIRNRNLFYVCCSRTRKRLALFISIPVDEQFDVYLRRVFGQTNIMTYTDFMRSLN